MPSTLTHGDAIKFYLTGAASDGAAQADPDLSLGNYRSSTEIEPTVFFPNDLIKHIEIQHLSGTDEGTAYLDARTGTVLYYKAPGDTDYGTGVTIANGETKIIESGNSRHYARVYRRSASVINGCTSLQIGRKVADVFGMSEVSNAERAAGEEKLRCICFMNVSASTVLWPKFWVDPLSGTATSDEFQLGASGAGVIGATDSDAFSLWDTSGWARVVTSGGTLREIVYYWSRSDTGLAVESGGRAQLGTSADAGAADDVVQQVPGIRLHLEAPSSDKFTVAATENDLTSMGAWTWYHQTTEAATTDSNTGLVSLAAGAKYSLWIRLTIPVGAAGHHLQCNSVNYSFFTL